MEGESKRNGSKKECHILLRPKPSNDLLPARDGEQPQFCVPRQRFLERATFLFTIILILMVCISRAIGDIAKRQLLYERVREEDHLGFEDFCSYQNRINVIQRSIEVLLAIPFGMLADTKGIRPVACLSLAGLILGDVYMYTVPYFDKAFPLSAVYGAPVLSVIGGGTLVFNGLVTAVIAAATPEKSRTSFFFWTQAAFTASSFITGFVNVLTIESGSNRFTFTFSTDEARRLTFVSICVQVLGFVVLFLISSYIVDSEDSMPEKPTAATVVRIRQAFRKDVASLLSQRRVFDGLAGLAIYGMGQILFSRATVALVRLAMERANAREQVSDIEETNAIQLINTIERVNGTIRLVLLTAVLPAVSLLLLRWKRDAATASLVFVCGSTALLAIGALGLGLWAKWSLDSSLSMEFSSVRWSYWIFSFVHVVASYDAPLRSALTFTVPVSQFSVLFTSIEAIQFLASLVGWEMFKYFSMSGSIGLLLQPLFIMGIFYALAWVLSSRLLTSTVVRSNAQSAYK